MEAARGFGKILFLVESGGPGGAERVVLSLAKSYQQSGVSVAVLTFRSGWFTEQLDKENIPRHHIVSHFPFDVTLPFRIARLIRQENIQVLHSHLLDSNFYGGLAARIAGVRHLATEHGDVHHPQSTKMMGFKLRILRALGTKFTAVSRYTAKALASFGVESSAISVVGNPIPTHAASSDGSSRALIRGELGIDESCWVWIHVANLRPVKDQRTLLEGFKLSCALDPKQHLLIVGDGPERAALEAQADSDSRISFLGHRDDVPSLLTASDGFILSSRSEALPMALLEAAAAQLVLVGSRVGGIPEVLGEGERGVLFTASDPKSLSQAIETVLKDKENAGTLAARAKKFVDSSCSPDRIAREYFALYSGRH